MRIAQALVGIVFAGMTGCAVDMDEPAVGEVESAVTILPSGGTWDYGETSPVSTTCNASLTQIEDGAFGIDQVTASTFRVSPRDGTAPFTCTSNSNGSFTCPSRAQFFIDLRPFVDAQFTMRAVVSGLFSDSRHARGKQDAIVSCVGSQCGLMGPNPCGYVVNFEVHAM